MPSNRKYYTNVEWEELICRCKASGLSDWRGCRENNISTSSFYRQLKKFRNTSVAPITERPLPDPSAFPEIQEVVPLTVRDETPVIPEPRYDGCFIPDSQRDDLLDLRKSRGIRKLV